MTVATYLYSKTNRALPHVNGLVAMVLVIDAAVDTTALLRKARAVTVANAHGHAVPTGYFDTEAQLAAFGTGVTTENLKLAGDCAIVGAFEVETVENAVEADIEVE